MSSANNNMSNYSVILLNGGEEIPIDVDVNVANMFDVESFRMVVENKDQYNCLSIDVFRDYIFDDVFVVGPSSTLIKYIDVRYSRAYEMLEMARVQSIVFKIHRERDGKNRSRITKLKEKWNAAQLKLKHQFETEYEIDPAKSFLPSNTNLMFPQQPQIVVIGGDDGCAVVVDDYSNDNTIRYQDNYDILKVYLHYSSDSSKQPHQPDLICNDNRESG